MPYLFIVFLLLGLVAPTYADQQTTLDLAGAIALSLEKNPRMGIADANSRAAAARIRQARQGTPISVGVSVENVLGSKAFRGVDDLEATLSVARVMESAEKPQARRRLAEKQALLLENRQDTVRLDLVAGVAGYFLDVLVHQEQVLIAEQQTQLLQHIHDLVMKRVKVGKSHRAEQRRSQIDLARAEIELEHARHGLTVARLKLATQWGETQAGFVEVQGDLFRLPALRDFKALSSLLDRNPSLLQINTEERIAEAQITLASLRQKPDIELAGGVRYFNQNHDAALVFSARMPLGSKARAQAYIDEQHQLAEQNPLRYESTYLALYSNLFELHQEMQHARTALALLDTEIIPLAEQTSADYEKGYQRGRFSLLELSEIQKTLTQARMERIDTAARYHRFRIQIERLTGSLLPTGEQP